jgi:hypothetical protein
VFARYRRSILAKIYADGPFPRLGKLDALWPTLVGVVAFGILDLAANPTEQVRRRMLAACLAPGGVWLAYTTFHELKALWLAARQRKRERGGGL